MYRIQVYLYVFAYIYTYELNNLTNIYKHVYICNKTQFVFKS